jgi:uncharacterized protein involved in exopolysaccharide biosynthesis
LLILVVVAVGFSFLQPDVYVAEARVLVEPLPDGSTVNIETEAEIAEKSAVASVVAARPELGLDPKSVTVRPAPQTEILIITVDAGTATRASDGANAVAERYLDLRSERYVQRLKVAIDKIKESISGAQRRLDELKQVSRPSAAVQDLKTRIVLRLGLLDQKLGELQPDLLRELVGAEVVAPAAPPLTRSSPSPKRNLALALAIGIPLIAGFILLQDPRRHDGTSDKP